MRRVVLSDTAARQLRALPRAVQNQAKEGIRLHLMENDATTASRNKFRLRRPSEHADYELRLGDLRVFYRVTGEMVEVVLIGRKRGDQLFIGGEEFEL